MVTHLAAFAGAYMPFGNILGPLVVWLVKKDDTPEVDRAGKEALNFQISLTIYSVIFFILFIASFFGIAVSKDARYAVIPFAGLALYFIVMLVDLVCVVVAAVKAQQGQDFRYPLAIRFLR